MLLPTLRVQERQLSHAPCPSGNGTMIGDEQKFTVYCNTRFQGDELFRQKTDSLTTCTNICTSFQNPRCEGAQFKDNGDCVLIGNIVPKGTRPNRFFDSALALFPQPGPTSSCSQQGSGTVFLSQNSAFDLQCGQILNGKDLEQQFQMTFEACLAACSTNTTCGGVSFDPQQDIGFKNCYLKSPFAASELLPKNGVDSAFIANNASPAADGNVAAGVATGTTVTSVVGTTATSVVGTTATSVVTTSATVVPDPVTIAGSVITVSVPVPTIVTSSTSALADSTATLSAGAGNSSGNGLGNDPGNGPGNGRGNDSNGGRPSFANVGSTTSSNAWIAAPVIGGVAALTLVLAIFILWGRRRRRDSPSNTRNAGPLSRGPLGNFGRGLGDAASRVSRGRIFGAEKMKLGDTDDDEESRFGSSRGGFKVVSGSGRRLGLEGQGNTGTGPGLRGMIVTTGGGKPVNLAGNGNRPLSRSSSSAGLRDSQNGLRQNRLTGNWLDAQPGIPAEFRGPDAK
ncbi:hypothetical protein F5Y19DRAFT_344725 [Xylariaceae sp. FL1651]|nr:hypothetical protein F5Y19DRAFT_344725 [Xylariaceae sp. FL1651]